MRVIIQPLIEHGLPARLARTVLVVASTREVVLELPAPSVLDFVAQGNVYKRELKKAGWTSVKWEWDGGQDVTKGYRHFTLSAVAPKESK